CASDTVISDSLIDGTSHQITGLTHQMTYTFRICAINANATPDVSSGVTVSATTSAQPAPNDPTDLSATVNAWNQVTLNWSSGGGTTADYRIAYQTGATAPANCSSGTTISEAAVNG